MSMLDTYHMSTIVSTTLDLGYHGQGDGCGLVCGLDGDDADDLPGRVPLTMWPFRLMLPAPLASLARSLEMPDD